MTENLDLKKGNFNKILQMTSLNSFALSFISIFIPVYLLNLGYSFQNVMVWLIIVHLSLAFFMFVAIKVSNHTGLVSCLQIRFIFLFITFFLLLFYLKDFPILFYIVPIFIGIHYAFYYIPLNILFTRNTKDSSMGDSMGKYFVLPEIVGMGGPIIGAIIIKYFGFNFLFALSMFLLLFVFLPISSLKSEKTNFIFSLSEAKKIFTKNRAYFTTEFLNSYVGDSLNILSIIIYLKLLSSLQVGIVGTITAVASMFLTKIVGKLTDNWNKNLLIRIGAVLVSFAWFVTYIICRYTPNMWAFYLATVITVMALRIFLIPYSSLFFNQARKGDAQFLVLSEIPSILGKIAVYVTGIVLYKNLPSIFIIVSLLFVYFWFIDLRRLSSQEDIK